MTTGRMINQQSQSSEYMHELTHVCTCNSTTAPGGAIIYRHQVKMVVAVCRVHYNPRVLVQTGERPYTEEELKSLIGDDDKIQAIKDKFERYAGDYFMSIVLSAFVSL